ncbi:hypothetical protein [Haloarchaeobius sp. DT45]|uniref:hypothetical protein n=1 Tax=Haloarchaeobius sp. DT45 TaxID=3446116 RepID=UPI003F6BBCF0
MTRDDPTDGDDTHDRTATSHDSMPTNPDTDDDSTDRPADADDGTPIRDAEPTVETGDNEPTAEADARPSRTHHEDDGGDGETGRSDGLQSKLYWLALGVLTLVSLYMLGVFYSNASRFIRLWVGTEFEPLVQAAFALVLLALSLVGIVRLTRELSD